MPSFPTYSFTTLSLIGLFFVLVQFLVGISGIKGSTARDSDKPAIFFVAGVFVLAAISKISYFGFRSRLKCLAIFVIVFSWYLLGIFVGMMAQHGIEDSQFTQPAAVVAVIHAWAFVMYIFRWIIVLYSTRKIAEQENDDINNTKVVVDDKDATFEEQYGTKDSLV